MYLQMKATRLPACGILLSVCLLAFGTGQNTPDKQGSQPALPPASEKKVNFSKDIRPILERSCLTCHGAQQRMGGFQIDTRELFLKGGASGPAVLEGDGENSLLISLVAGRVPGKIMPLTGTKLTAEEIGLLRGWIDQGLDWVGGFSFSAGEKRSIQPRRPEIPSTGNSGLSNPIDLFLQEYFKENGFTPPEPVSDRVFARRVYLDIIGLLPIKAELEDFLADKHPDKRERLVHTLLSDNKRYAEHWLTFWNDLLRNQYRGTGYIDGGRTQITHWLLQSLEENKPYNQFVSELIAPVTGSEGFSKGIIWRGVVNASQVPEMQAAQNISQVFMGINLKCASCHDSFINNWKLADSYGLASVFSDHPLEMVRCNAPTGKISTVRFLYPELGEIVAETPSEKRRVQLAQILTSEENGQFTRTIVNRLWAKFMGHGLIEPVDDMEGEPWYSNLLDYLAVDLSDNGYDLHKTMERILTSRAYQLPSVGMDEMEDRYVFKGPSMRRMTAEQFVDAVSSLTGVWQLLPQNFFEKDGRNQGGQAPEDIHSSVRYASGRIHQGSATVEVDVSDIKTLRLVVTDDRDGKHPTRAFWANPRLIGAQGELPLTQLDWQNTNSADGSLPSVITGQDGSFKVGDFDFDYGLYVHSKSALTFDIPDGYTKFTAEAGLDPETLSEDGGEMNLEFYVLSEEESLRAAFVDTDPLMQALGRSRNREQVITTRDSLATTLQALEMTNGETLDTVLKKGARSWLENYTTESDSQNSIVDEIFWQALGREPTQDERKTALAVAGSPVQQEGIEDLLWIVSMLPEFQLIY